MIVCLDGPDGFDRQTHRLEVIGPPHRGRAHLLATGRAAAGAIELAVRRPAGVASLLLGDPELDPAAVPLAAVRVPALIVAARSDPAQAIAGTIPHGVLVIIEGEAPAHRTHPDSFDEWISSFVAIADGLGGTDA